MAAARTSGKGRPRPLIRRPSGSHFLARNFLGLPARLARYESARVAVLPVPYDSTTSYRAGTRDGPAAILAASRQVELFDDELRVDPSTVGVATLADLVPDMRGPRQQVDRVERAVARILADGKMVVMLGGEHSVTTGAVRAHLRLFDDLSVLQIDAHGDMRDRYEGTRWNHACVLRRVHELCPVVGVGLRNISAEETNFMEGHRLEPFLARDIVGRLDWVDRAVDGLSDHVYVTVDLDGLDPSYMPAVGTPEPGGLSWYEALALFRRVAERRRIVGFDVMELCPIPGLASPDFIAAKLTYKILAYAFFARERPTSR